MELWKDIVDYEGHYQISNLGAVKALYREFICSDGTVRKYPERILKPDECCTSKIKYQRVTLSKNHCTRRFQVHRLVATHFIANPKNKPFINHIDNNGLNNKVDNLEWVTHSENMIHAQKQGRLHKAQSTGGLIGGAVTKQRMLDKVASITDTVIGCYLVKSLGKPNKHNKVTLNVVCIYCHNAHVRTLDYINNNAPSRCCLCNH